MKRSKLKVLKEPVPGQRRVCCGERVTAHSCPYKSDVDGDDTTLCNCCEACEQMCADDI